jgi:hypothetical protein
MPRADWPPAGTVTALARPTNGGLTVDQVGPLLPKDIA